MSKATGFEKVDAEAAAIPGGSLGEAVKSIDEILKQKDLSPTVCDLAMSARQSIFAAAGGGSVLVRPAWPEAA